MNMQDPISDFATRIRNAQMMKKNSVSVIASKQVSNILEILHKEGYIVSYEPSSDKRFFTIVLKYYQNKSVIESIVRISKPSHRVYSGASDLPKVLNGLGIAVVSTSKGVMTDKSARNLNVGGEVLLYVY